MRNRRRRSIRITLTPRESQFSKSEGRCSLCSPCSIAVTKNHRPPARCVSRPSRRIRTILMTRSCSNPEVRTGAKLLIRRGRTILSAWRGSAFIAGLRHARHAGAELSAGRVACCFVWPIGMQSVAEHGGDRHSGDHRGISCAVSATAAVRLDDAMLGTLICRRWHFAAYALFPHAGARRQRRCCRRLDRALCYVFCITRRFRFCRC